MDLTTSLRKIGLTQNEAEIYIALLKLGTSKTGEILKEANINSGKIYNILESLKLKGLVSESSINNVRCFTAASPNEIFSYIGEKKKDIQEEETSLKAVLPQFEQIRKQSLNEVRSTTYTGIRGIQTAVNEALDDMKAGDVMLAMGVTHRKDAKINTFWERWQAKRVQKKVHQRIIFSEQSKFHKTLSKTKFTQTKILENITPAAIDLFSDDKTLIFTYSEQPSCILIYDKNINKSFRAFFEQLWKMGK